MKYKVIWNKSAERNLNNIVDYIIENNGKRIAKKIYDNIKEKALLLPDNPKMGRNVPELLSFGEKYREIIVSPWSIIYRVDQNIIYILMVVDRRRNIEDILFDILIKIDNQ